MIFSWGANSHGQLGLGIVNEQVEKPSQVLISPSLNVTEIKQIACGGGHSLLIDSEGKLFSCGWNHKLQLGTEKIYKSFERVWNLGGIVFTSVACGWDFSCGVTNDNFLFVWGSNANGELGLPKEHFPAIVKPVRLQVKAHAVSMGLRHSAIVNSKGEVWITGCGRHGQLGLGEDIVSSDRFVQVPKVGKITHIACGQNHTTAWCSDEKALYVWGDNRHGQLLLDKEKYKKVFNAQKIDIGVKHGIKKLLSGWTNSLLWLDNGTLLTWGRNNYGQLGTETGINNKLVNVQLPGGKEVIDVALGSEHTICLMNDNTLWAWGWNEHGNTATKIEDQFIPIPTAVDLGIETNLHVTQIFAGSAHNFIIARKSEFLESDIETQITETKVV